MRKTLIVVFVMAAVALVTGTVMSQGTPAQDAKRSIRVPNADDNRERQNRNEVANILQQAKDKLRRLNAPGVRDLELMTALNTYILDNQFDAVIKHLEEIMVASSDTPAAARAEIAIRVLRGEESITTTAPEGNPVDPRNGKKGNERDPEDRRRPATPADDHDKP